MKKLRRDFVLLFIILYACISAVVMGQNQTPSPAMQEAIAFMQAQKWAEAATAFEAVIKNEPANGQAWFQLGIARHSLGEYAKAVEAYLKRQK